MDVTLNSTDVPEITATTLWNAFIVCYLVVILATVFGNVAVIAAYISNEFVRISVSNAFILNLSISDIIVGSVVMLCDFINLVLGYWPFGDICCAMWQSVHYFAIYMSVVTIIVISIDRLWLISDVLRYKVMVTHRLAGYSLLCVWVYTLLYSMIYALSTEDIRSPSTRRGGTARCFVASQNSDNSTTSIILENMDFALSITLLVAINVTVACKARQKLNNRDLGRVVLSKGLKKGGKVSVPSISYHNRSPAQFANGETGRVAKDNCENAQHVGGSIPESNLVVTISDDNNDIEKTSLAGNRQRYVDYKMVARNLFVLTGVYTVCWLPFHILVISQTLNIFEASEIAWEVLQRLIWFNSMLNPILYAIMNIRFRLGMLRIVCSKRNYQAKINRLNTMP